jgi:hypothetical protein
MNETTNQPVRHCWQGYHEQWPDGSDEWARHYHEPSATCLLPKGHEGPHQFTPDDQIIVQFPENSP